MFVCVAHGDDVVQLLVEVKPFVWSRDTHTHTVNNQQKHLLSDSVNKGISFMPPTCIIDGVPHLEAADAAGLVFVVSSEDQLEAHEETDVRCFAEDEQELSGVTAVLPATP